MNDFSIIQGNALEALKTLPSESVQTCITSPPYWGLRDYQTQLQVWGGSTNCNHDFCLESKTLENRTGQGLAELGKHYAGGGHKQSSMPVTEVQSGFCKHCDAWLGELGQNPTPDLFIQHLVWIFKEVKRVLKDDGTLWVNMGDSYSSGNRKSRDPGQSDLHPAFNNFGAARAKMPDGINPKDLIGIPWMLAFALRADGWYLRSDIIWHKPNPMPESVTDRPTKAHEYIFLLSKSERYYYDHEAIKEPVSEVSLKRAEYGFKISHPSAGKHGIKTEEMGKRFVNPSGRNKRSVWSVATQSFSGAHFATFPPELIRPCILAGSRQGDTVLDPFNGAGTTGMVANQHQRSYIGIELNQDFIEITNERVKAQLMQPRLALEVA